MIFFQLIVPTPLSVCNLLSSACTYLKKSSTFSKVTSLFFRLGFLLLLDVYIYQLLIIFEIVMSCLRFNIKISVFFLERFDFCWLFLNLFVCRFELLKTVGFLFYSQSWQFVSFCLIYCPYHILVDYVDSVIVVLWYDFIFQLFVILIFIKLV